MKKIYSLFATALLASSFYAQVITQWNFDASNLAPSTGTGTIDLIGGVTPNTTNPWVNGNPSTGKSYSTQTYPAQSTDSGTAGARFNVSTVGYSSVSISVDLYASNTQSKYVQLQYTTDGNTWVNGTSSPSQVAGSWSTVTASLPVAANNNANFAFRVVTIFDPANNTSYTPVGSSSTYATGGALRFDNVTVSSGTLAVTDVKNTKSANFVRNTFVKNNEITFGADVKDVKIFNMLGQVVKKASVRSNETINVSDLVSGDYIVTGTINNQPVSQKILKD